MANLKSVVDTKEWPCLNETAFWSLSERVEGVFELTRVDHETNRWAQYRLRNTASLPSKILRAPFDACHSIRLDWDATGDEPHAKLCFNGKVVDTAIEGEFDLFGPETVLPLGLMSSDDAITLDLYLFDQPCDWPSTLGSARMLRFNWKDTNKPFVVATGSRAAVMYDGYQLRAVSTLEPAGPSGAVSGLSQNVTVRGPNGRQHRSRFWSSGRSARSADSSSTASTIDIDDIWGADVGGRSGAAGAAGTQCSFTADHEGVEKATSHEGNLESFDSLVRGIVSAVQ